MSKESNISVKIETYGVKETSMILPPCPLDQTVQFYCNNNGKGRSVSMELTSETFIHAPGFRIFFNKKDLKNILDFLDKSC